MTKCESCSIQPASHSGRLKNSILDIIIGFAHEIGLERALTFQSQTRTNPAEVYAVMMNYDELEQRVLSELEESSERDIVHLINITSPADGTSVEIDALSKALRALLGNGDISVAMQTFIPRSLTSLTAEAATALLADLGQLLKYGDYGSYWHYATLDVRRDEYPTILATENGLEKARIILRARGYQWWQPNRKR